MEIKEAGRKERDLRTMADAKAGEAVERAGEYCRNWRGQYLKDETQ